MLCEQFLGEIQPHPHTDLRVIEGGVNGLIFFYDIENEAGH